VDVRFAVAWATDRTAPQVSEVRGSDNAYEINKESTEGYKKQVDDTSKTGCETESYLEAVARTQQHQLAVLKKEQGCAILGCKKLEMLQKTI
jgi:hypothetical protein